MTDAAASALRQTDRRNLLSHLVKLGHADPEQRAKAALAATALLQRKGLDWSALLPADPAKTATVSALHNWQRRAFAMSEHPAVTPDERVYLNKLSGWKTPGLQGMTRMRAIADRIGVELD